MNTHEEATRLLANVGQLKDDRSRILADTAERFNVFDALKIEDLELAHSKFLAYLLNPRQRHDQGDILLRSFLALVGISPPSRSHDVEVFTEIPIPGGRLDIFLRIPTQMTIVLENKVWAGDQDEQIGKYLRWLNTEPMNTPMKFVIYLTPSGRFPREPIFDFSQIKRLSYTDVANWLERHTFPDRLQAVTAMYSETCRRIARGNMKDETSNDIVQLLSSSSNFSIALDIASVIEAQRPRVVEKFWENVRDNLARRLTDIDLSLDWAAVLSPEEVTDKYCCLSIVCANRSAVVEGGNPTNYKPGYSVTAEHTVDGQWYGVWRPSVRKSTELERLDKELSNILGHTNFKPTHRSWCGWRYLSDGGLVSQSQNQNEFISKLNTDNQNADTPLACQVANGMWGLFDTYRERLEAINLLT